MIKIRDLPDEDLFVSGHTACPGCGCVIAVRNIMKVLGKNTITYTPANCLLVFGATYPHVAWKVPYHHVLFENTAACLCGISRAMKKLGKEDVVVAGFAGDGGTADIGIQALSGTAERNENILYICYDNEAYMNTGIQRSGATPYGAWTTTTPLGKVVRGKQEFKKDVPMIMIMHEIPYVATASVGNLIDLLNKVEKAKNIRGMRYLHILAPCPTGWQFPTNLTIKIAKLAVETGMWSLYEYMDGKLTINVKPKMTPVEEYIKLQGRFRGMSKEKIDQLQNWVSKKWEGLQKLAELMN